MIDLQVGPRGKEGKRIVVALFDQSEHRDRFDTDSAFLRQKFREACESKFGCNGDERIESRLIQLADAEDDRADAPVETDAPTPEAPPKQQRRPRKPKAVGNPMATDVRNDAGRTDHANSRRFAAMFGDDVRWCEPWRKWLVWDGQRWKVDQERRAEALAKETADVVWAAVAVELSSVTGPEQQAMIQFARGTSSGRGIGNMLALARSEPGIAVLPEDLDSHPWLLNVQNGTLDLRTGELRDHDRGDRLTKLCRHEYLPGAAVECPGWQAFLDRIFDSNDQMIQFVQRLFGHALVGKSIEHVLPILWGKGANGKSVLVETILHVLGGDFASSAPPDLLLSKRGETHPTEKADLFGKRLVVAVETDDGRRLAEGTIKQLTGGDTVKARRMREDFWQFTPSHTVALVTNHRPEVRGTDLGIWRRLRLVPFTVTIPEDEQDRHLTDKLKREAAGILRWLVDGCLGWQRDGLDEPDEVLAATSDYRAEQDVVGSFLDEMCLNGEAYRVKAGSIYKSYVDWCDGRGEHAKSNRQFGEAMTERGFQRQKSSSVWYLGVGLREF